MKSFTVVLPNGPGSDQMVTVAEGVQFSSGEVVVASIAKPFFQVRLPSLSDRLPGFPVSASLVWNPEADGQPLDIPSSLDDRDWRYLVSLVEAKAGGAERILGLRLRELLLKMKAHEVRGH